MGWDLSLQRLTLACIGAESWLNVGAWSWFADLELPTPPALKFYELHPPRIELKDVDFRPLCRTFGSTPRSLEVWWDGDLARIIYAADTPAAISPFKQAYKGLDVEGIKETEPSWVKKLEKAPLFFDVEQMHALPFCKFVEKHRGEFLNHLIGSLEGCSPAWLQIVTCAADWGSIAETFANTMDQIVDSIKKGAVHVETGVRQVFGPQSIPVPVSKSYRAPVAHETGSTVGAYGHPLAAEAVQKGQLSGSIVHVRGLVADPSTAAALASAIEAAVKISFDFAVALPYDDPRFLRWLRSRFFPDPTLPLKIHAEGGFVQKWSHELKRGRRTLIPVFCTVPSELACFNCLPTDPELPVRGRGRRRAKKMGKTTTAI